MEAGCIAIECPASSLTVISSSDVVQDTSKQKAALKAAASHLDRAPESGKKIEVEMGAFAIEGSASSLTVIPSSDVVPDTSKQKEALKAAASHLPWVPLSALPPFTHACGRPGASGSVFKIEFQGKVAAAKEFHKHMHDMLRRELKTLQLLAHPNIVRVLAVVIDAATQPVGFVMEYLPVPLDEAMQRMTLRQALHTLVEACVGVAVAHDAKVIHSDIKPGNILCSDDFSVVKLADFGLAHAVTVSMSAVSMARGTPLYVVRLCALHMLRPTVDHIKTIRTSG